MERNRSERRASVSREQKKLGWRRGQERIRRSERPRIRVKTTELATRDLEALKSIDDLYTS